MLPLLHVVLRVATEQPHVVTAREQRVYGRTSHDACAARHKNSHRYRSVSWHSVTLADAGPCEP